VTTHQTRGAFLALAAAAAVICVTSSARADLVFYEGFDYLPGDLHGNNNTSVEPDDVWTRAGTVAAANIDVSAGTLTSPAGASTGGKVTITNPATASTERLNFPAINSGTVWYSLTFNATLGSPTAVNTGAGAYFVGFSSLDDNGDVDSGAAPAVTNIAGRLALRVDPTNASFLNVALTNTSAQTAGSYAAAQIPQGTDVFAIVSYEIVAGAGTNDVAKLWLNPNVATFNPSDTPTLSVTGQADLVDVKSFFLRQTGGLPETLLVDEVRVGTTFADVVPEPGSSIITGLATGALLVRRRRRPRSERSCARSSSRG
jgi:hypothetical protein